jgi:outer membrane protein assembly factor BamB
LGGAVVSAPPGGIIQPLDKRCDPARIGVFELRGLIGQGGMARVYLGVSNDGGQVAAIKTISPKVPAAVLDEYRVRLWRESNAYQRMRGFRTPLWYADNMGGRELPERPWVAVRYIPAPSLKQLVRTAGPLPLPVGLRLVEKLAAVLIQLERRGLVHRDITPGNVLISRDSPWLVDFGLVSDVENPSDVLATERKGTSGYAAPEHARAERTTVKADVYALGRLLHFAVTGLGPAEGEGDFVPRRPGGTPDLTGLPDDVYRLVADCMHKEPGPRPWPHELSDSARRLAEEKEAAYAARAAYPPGSVTSDLGRLPAEAARVLEWYEDALPAGEPPRARPAEEVPTRPLTGRVSAPVHVAGGVLPGRPDPGALTRVAARWTAALPGRIYYATPLPYRGRLLVAGRDGTVLALDPATGDRLWDRSLGAGVECALAAGEASLGGVVVAGCADRTVRGLALADGAELWRHATGDTVPSTPAVFGGPAGGLVCVGDREGGVHALDPASGAVRWRARVDGRGVYGPPAVSPDGATVYVTAWDGRLYAFDAATGARRWASAPHGELHGGPAVHGERVFTGSRDRHLRAFDAATGRELWRSPTTGAVRATPLVSAGRVWAGCMGGGLYGVPLDGTADRAVRVQTGVPVRSAATAQHGWVLMGGADGHIHALHTASGEHRRWYAADAPLDGGVASASGLVFTASVACLLHAVNALPEQAR